VSTENQPPPGDPRRGSPGMQPTKPGTLLVAGVAAAAVAWLVMRAEYGSLPQLPWLPPVTIFALAVVEAVLARTTRARIEHRPGAARVDPLSVARFVVLAKASALAGALIAGAYAGITGWLLLQRGRGLAAVSADTPPAVAGLLGGMALLIAGLLLERACQVPKRPDDDEPA
jgi:hypothetical protein